MNKKFLIGLFALCLLPILWGQNVRLGTVPTTNTLFGTNLLLMQQATGSNPPARLVTVDMVRNPLLPQTNGTAQNLTAANGFTSTAGATNSGAPLTNSAQTYLGSETTVYGPQTNKSQLRTEAGLATQAGITNSATAPFTNAAPTQLGGHTTVHALQTNKQDLHVESTNVVANLRINSAGNTSDVLTRDSNGRANWGAPSAGGADRIATNNGAGYRTALREGTTSEGITNTVAPITNSAPTQLGGAVTTHAASTNKAKADFEAAVTTKLGVTNLSTTPTMQSAPLMILGTLIFPPTTNTALTVNVATNAIAGYTTNADFTVTFTGTAADGARGEYRVWNTAATNINLTWPASYFEQAGAGATSIPCVSNSVTRIIWRIESGSNYVSVASKDLYVWTPNNPTAGQLAFKIHCLTCGPGGSMVLTNADDATGAAGTVIRFQTNTTTVGSQTNFNWISTNVAELGFLGTNNSTTGSADLHVYIGANIARDAEVFGFLVASNYVALKVNDTAISDSGSLSNVAATATQQGVTVTVAPGTHPNPDIISISPGNASATVAGAMTAQAQIIGGRKGLPNGMDVNSGLTANHGTFTNAVTNVTGVELFGALDLDYELLDGLPMMDFVNGGARMMELKLRQSGGVGTARYYEDGANGTDSIAVVPPSSIAANRTQTRPDRDGTLLLDNNAVTIKTTGGLEYGGPLIGTNRMEAAGAAIISPAQITSTQHDYNPSGLAAAQIVRINTDASRDISGIQSLPIWKRLMRFDNIGSANVVFLDDNTGSFATNRMALSGSLTLGPDQSCLFGYDVTSLRWRLEAGPSASAAGGGGGTNTALFIQTNSVPVSNTGTETSLVGSGVGSTTLPANYLIPGRNIRGQLRGIYNDDAVTPGTVRIKVKLGSTIVLDTTAQTPASGITDDYFEIDFDITCRSTGASGTVFAQGQADLSDGLITTHHLLQMINTAPVTVDTTSSQVLDVTWQWGTADTDNRATNQITIFCEGPGVSDSLNGDFVGPAFSTDNAAVRFNGTGGKSGQDSGLIISDTGELNFKSAFATNWFSGNIFTNIGESIVNNVRASGLFNTNSFTNAVDSYIGGVARESAHIVTNYSSANDFTNRSLTSTLIKSDSGGKQVAAVSGTDYVAPTTVIQDSTSLPIGAWFTNNLLGAHPSGASSGQFTNVSDRWFFADALTNGIRFIATPVVGWDAGVVRLELKALCTGTNHTSSTNVVFGVRAAALKTGADWSSPTFGTLITVTNHIHIDANKPGIAITRDITIGNTPESTNSILYEIQRIGADAGDTLTNSAGASLVDTRLLFKRTLGGSWPEPSP